MGRSAWDPQVGSVWRSVWDPCGKIRAGWCGIRVGSVGTWRAGPLVWQVLLPGGDGKKGSLFDQLEDLDFADALSKCSAIAAAQ